MRNFSVEERRFLLTGKLKEYVGKNYVFRDADEDTILFAIIELKMQTLLSRGKSNTNAIELSKRMLMIFKSQFSKYVSDVGIEYKTLDNYGLTQMIRLDFMVVNKNIPAFDDALFKKAFKILNIKNKQK